MIAVLCTERHKLLWLWSGLLWGTSRRCVWYEKMLKVDVMSVWCVALNNLLVAPWHFVRRFKRGARRRSGMIYQVVPRPSSPSDGSVMLMMLTGAGASSLVTVPLPFSGRNDIGRNGTSRLNSHHKTFEFDSPELLFSKIPSKSLRTT